MEQDARPKSPIGTDAVLLTGAQDRHYAFGLAMALVSQGVCLDIVGSDEIDSPEMHTTLGLRFLNLRGDQRRKVAQRRKISRVLLYYARLIRYAVNAKPKIFHILWNNKFEFFDRTLLMLYYKLLGKTIVFTAHNVNIAKRDLCDTLPNRLTLWIQYRLSDHVFVHTDQMKRELVEGFGVRETAVTVIPYGINSAVPETDLTAAEARRRLGISDGDRTILFFGAIAPYKGLDLLIDAFRRLRTGKAVYRLIIAGRPKRGWEEYSREIGHAIRTGACSESIIQTNGFIPDEEIELYFKAADVLALPYRRVFQSGVLFLGFKFGLPVVATDIGSFGQDIIEGRTGYVCKPADPADLAKAFETYFSSELFRRLDSRRRDIREWMSARHSWDVVARMTRDVYAELLGRPTSDPP